MKRSITYATDAAGHPVDAFYLDYFQFVLLAAVLLLAEWRFGATLGKRLLRVRVRVQSFGGSPLTFAQAAKRTAMRFIPFVPLLAWQAASASFLMAHMISMLVAVVASSVVLWVAFVANFMRAVDRNDLPWHDRWAHTEAVWTGPPTQSEQPTCATSKGAGS